TAELLEGTVVENVAVLVDLDEGGPLVPGGPLDRLGEVRRVHVEAPRHEGCFRRDGYAEGVDGLLGGAEGGRLGLLPKLRSRRVLPLRQSVDPVVEQQDLDVQVAAQTMDQMIAPDAQPVAVPGDHPDRQLRSGRLETGGQSGRTPVAA